MQEGKNKRLSFEAIQVNVEIKILYKPNLLGKEKSNVKDKKDHLENPWGATESFVSWKRYGFPSFRFAVKSEEPKFSDSL